MKYIDKPWGHELIWAHTDKYVGKILHIKKGQMLSLQYHNEKDETLFVHSGKVDVITQDERGELRSQTLREYQSIHFPAKAIHRLIAIEETEILEVSTPQLDDIVRLDDAYGRIESN